MSQERDQVMEALLRRGYVPLPTKGKVWVENFRQEKLRYDTSAPDPDITRAAFREHPDAGISITAPYIRDSLLKLVGIDVDIRDGEHLNTTMSRVAAIIGQPCPVKRGKKGGTFFCTFEGLIQLKTLYAERRGDNVKATWLKEGKVIAQFPKGPNDKAEGIDLIGQGPYYHSVIPPSIHPETKEPYAWVPFPGQTKALRLQDLDPGQLPKLKPYHFLLLALCMNPNLDKIWEFIGATSPGDFNDRMRDGTLALHHEGFTQEEILEIAAREAERDPPDAQTLASRLAAVRGTVAKLDKKFPDKKPARQIRGPRTPPDRQQADWLIEELGEENLGRFNALPYLWNGQHWNLAAEIDHDVPLNDWYTKIKGAFPDSNHGSISSALKMVMATIPVRKPNPSPDLIPFLNGILHVPTLTLRPETRDDNFVGHLPHEFKPDATCPRWDIYIRDLTLPPKSLSEDPEEHRQAKDLIEEFLGYCLTRSYRHSNFLMIVGKPKTGKTVLTHVLKGLLPKEWVSEVSLDRFVETNSLRRMMTSYVNVSSEIGRSGAVRGVEDIVLRVTSREPVEVKVLYKDSMEIVLPTRLIVSGNMTPDFNDATGAIERRSLLVRATDVPVDKSEEVLAYEDRLLEEAPGILVRLVTAYGRMLARGQGFIQPGYAVRENREATAMANSVSAWVHTSCALTDSEETKKGWTDTNELYGAYREWCEFNGHKPFSSTQWGKLLVGMGIRTKTRRLPAGNFVTVRPLRLLSSAMTGADF